MLWKVVSWAQLLGGFAERVVHRLLVPLDPGERVLVLVLHAEHVAELVQRGAAAVGRREVPAVHGRRLVQRDLQHVAADRRRRLPSASEYPMRTSASLSCFTSWNSSPMPTAFHLANALRIASACAFGTA